MGLETDMGNMTICWEIDTRKVIICSRINVRNVIHEICFLKEIYSTAFWIACATRNIAYDPMRNYRELIESYTVSSPKNNFPSLTK